MFQSLTRSQSSGDTDTQEDADIIMEFQSLTRSQSSGDIRISIQLKLCLQVSISDEKPILWRLR